MAVTKRKIQFIKSELIADSVIDVLEREGFFDLYEKTSTKIINGDTYFTWEKVKSSIEALDELRRAIIDEIDDIV